MLPGIGLPMLTAILENVPEHLEANRNEEKAKGLLELARGQGMGEAHANGRREAARAGNAQKGPEMHKAQAGRGQIGPAPAAHDVAKRAGHGNGKANGRGCAHGGMHGHVAISHEGHGKGTAANAHKAGNHADHAAGGRCPHGARHAAAGLWLVFGNHFCGNGKEEADEKDFQEHGGQMGGDEAAKKGAQQYARRNVAENVPAHRAAPVVGKRAGNGGEHDGGQGSAQGQLLHILRRHALGWENRHQHGHDHRSPAHAEQTGKHSNHRAAAKIDDDRKQHGISPFAKSSAWPALIKSKSATRSTWFFALQRGPIQLAWPHETAAGFKIQFAFSVSIPRLTGLFFAQKGVEACLTTTIAGHTRTCWM